MSTRNSSRFTPIIIAISVVAGILIGTFYAKHFAGNRLGIINGSSNKLNALLRIVDDQYVDTVNMTDLVEKAMPQILAELDPHSTYIPAQNLEEVNSELEGSFSGIGIQFTIQNDTIHVNAVIQGGPSEKVGLMAGDRIVNVDDSLFVGKKLNNELAMRTLKGPKGSQVKLGVKRVGEPKLLDFTITRGDIPQNTVDAAYMLNDDIGYVKVSKFGRTSHVELLNALAQLNHKKCKGLIIDLRGNGGGILQEAVKILSMFVPKGTEVVSMRGRMKELDATFVTQSEPIDTQIPVAVLINSSSASAAEIVAGAFQDLDRGVLLGQRSFGKGLVQSTRPVGYNAYLKLTTAKYYTPSGRCIQAIDYSHRAEDGSVGTVPDSLIKEYTTKAGRKVYDGGGVMPDIRMPDNYYSRFTNVLYGKGYIEDFANLYYKKHQEGVDVDNFELSDADYNEFVRFMADKPVDFESETQQTLSQLRQKAERDKYLDRIEGELNAIEQKIRDDKQADLQAFKKEIKELIGDEIVMRYHYIQGVARHNSHLDPEILEAIKVLQDPARYHQIITSQDTQRK